MARPTKPRHPVRTAMATGWIVERKTAEVVVVVVVDWVAEGGFLRQGVKV